MSRFDYIEWDEESEIDQKMFKTLFELIEKGIEEEFSQGRSKSTALTKLEETYMWIGKAIRDEQILRLKQKDAGIFIREYE